MSAFASVFAILLSFSSAAFAQSGHTGYCSRYEMAQKTCAVVSTDVKLAAKVCAYEGGVKAVYTDGARGEFVLVGYVCAGIIGG